MGFSGFKTEEEKKSYINDLIETAKTLYPVGTIINNSLTVEFHMPDMEVIDNNIMTNLEDLYMVVKNSAGILHSYIIYRNNIWATIVKESPLIEARKIIYQD